VHLKQQQEQERERKQLTNEINVVVKAALTSFLTMVILFLNPNPTQQKRIHMLAGGISWSAFPSRYSPAVDSVK